MRPFRLRGVRHRPGRAWLIVAVAGALVGAMLLPGAAAAKGKDKAHKVDICHLRDDGTYKVLNVSVNAVPAHQAHGDLVVGVDVDENCDPLEALLAVAYTNLDGSPGFSAGGDVLIAKLVDTNGDGVVSAEDTVVTNRYPLDVDATGFGSFTVTSHVVDSVAFTVPFEAVVLTAAPSPGSFFVEFAFFDQPGRQEYVEVRDFITSRFLDVTDPLLGSDIAVTSSGSPSVPDMVISDVRLRTTPDPFIDVDIFV